MRSVAPPNKEHMLFAQLQVAQGLVEYIYDNLENTIFEENEDINESMEEIVIGLFNALLEMNTAMVTSCERKSVCY